MLVNKAGKVFVAERIDTPGAWQMPQGGIDAGERPRAAAKRELLEETGTDKAKIIATSKGWLRYELPAYLVGKVWRGKYRGQEQKWYVMLFEGRDRDVDLAQEHPEFSRWKWVAFARLPKLIVGFKRALYEQVVAEFADVMREIAPRKQKLSRRPSARGTRGRGGR